MNLELRSLIRQQWRERRLTLAVCSGWMLCCLVYVVAYECSYRFRDPVAGLYISSLMLTLFAAIFLAMKTALGEQTLGTFGFSQALPLTRQRLARTRMTSAVITLVVPIILGALVMTPLLWSGFLEQAPTRLPNSVSYGRIAERPSLSAAEAVGLLWTVAAVAIAGGVQLLLVLSILGTRLRSESQIGFCGAILFFVWTLLPEIRLEYEALRDWLGALLPASLIINWSYGDIEGGSYADLEIGQPLWASLGTNLLVLALLFLWFVRWYGRRSVAHRSSRVFRWRRWPAVWSRIPVSLPNRATALVWINLRQSLPLAFFGLLLAALITFFQFSGNNPEESFRTQLPSSTWIVAAVWATVVGAGVFAAELQPSLSSFWQSRPLTVGTWFWCKFSTGLVAVLGVLDGATIWVSWGTPIGHATGLSWSYIACMPVVHATLYAVAVLGVCWTRRPAVGAMLAIVAFFTTTILMSSIVGESYEPFSIHHLLLVDEIAGQFDLSSHNYPLVYGVLIAVLVASAWLASRAIRRPERGDFRLWMLKKNVAKH